MSPVIRTFAFVVLLITGFAAGVAISARLRTDTPAPQVQAAGGQVAPVDAVSEAPQVLASQGTETSAPITASAPRLQGAPDFTGIAGRAVRGVVNISSVSVVRAPTSPFANDPFFRSFFGDDPFTREQRSSSLGSGVLVSADGYIVTNNHVIGQNSRSSEITVTLADNRELPGTVVGVDPATDLALVKVDATGLPALQWGDSGRLQIGEWVLAIGSPFQLSQTVTAGIVSATGRANVGFAQYEDFIQTDAAINPGNSGGALINTSGELVGINTGIFSQSGGYQGIGFAVPSLLARRVVDDLSIHGEVRRGTIEGIRIQAVTPQAARELGLSDVRGVLVTRMVTNAPAYAAGLRPGDVIRSFENSPVTDPSQLFRLVSDARIGSTARLTVVRDGQSLEFRVPIVAASAGTQR